MEYTQIIEKMLDGIEVRLNCDYFEHKEELENIAKKIIFTDIFMGDGAEVTFLNILKTGKFVNMLSLVCRV